MLELYQSWRSTCSRKVRICLDQKGLACELKTLDLKKFEHHRPEYLKLNPNGVVPTLVHDGRVLIESTLINEYLEEVFPEPPLRPKDPLALHRMRVWCKLADDVALPAVVVPTWSQVLTPSIEGTTDDERQKILDRIPLPERRSRWAKLAAGGYSQADFKEAYDKMRLVVERMEQALREGPWLLGESLTLADVSLVPYIYRFREIDPVLLEPRISAWLDRFLERSGVKNILTRVS